MQEEPGNLLHHITTGCLKITWTFVKISRTPILIRETFQNILWLKQFDAHLH